MLRKYIGRSFKRGCIQLVRRPMYFLLIIIMPLLCSWFLMDLIKDGAVQRVPVGIVDQDNSDMSRRISRNLNGFQQVNICQRYNNLQRPVMRFSAVKCLASSLSLIIWRSWH